ncbi:ABC transporter permease [Kitasatospora aureofaciens]|uniref:ABC transporter permease n=2 Tax=Streptomycetaceae TaxID=2062 RepID=A0A1E7MWT2_KITAU|nr:ABC transporter permease [Kitasatospora aureofaciens]QEV00071.1 ABC transporter permease [Streptomyces viridifaciens]ARF78867.1 ABC transporter permease [Kitasatospora aureofaciens]OEV32890.1 ABC transporter permease [Kitasatospora aureofaciens]UKZ06257.1 ABC transporter permease [Streptomyces viridifaciens]GGU76725.1 ABC transporter permease [Kitasatospora aureofaciens]
MGRFVARRLLQMIPVFLGTTALIFFMVHLLPGDPLAALWGDKAPDPVQLAALRHQQHFDEPLIQQYLDYMGGLFTGDFGKALDGRPVLDKITEALPVTVQLALLAFGFEIVLGIGIGLFAGLRRGKVFDKSALVFTLLLISIPVPVLGFLFQTIFGINLKWVKPTVQDSTDITQLVLPAIVLGSLSLAYVARLTRTSIAENIKADYVRTAVAKGLPRRRVIGTHLLRNSLIPVVTFLGTDLGALMGGAIVTEGIFNVQGVGHALYQAINMKEGATVSGFVAFLVIVYLAAGLIVDLLYAVLDPRIRYA